MNTQPINPQSITSLTAGKYIFDSLPTASEQDKIEMAKALVKAFPTTKYTAANPSSTHMPQALVIRQIFDCEKNGSLLDQSNPERSEQYRHNLDVVGSEVWRLGLEFCLILEQEFKNEDHLYGLTILYEMLGHRFGDLSLQGHDQVDKMESYYMQAYQLAKKIPCPKHIFSTWFWGACYFSKLGINDKAKQWHLNFQKEAEVHMGAKDSFVNKLRRSVQMLRPLMSEAEFRSYSSKKRHSRNLAFKKVFSSV